MVLCEIVNNFHSFVSSQISCICIEYFKVFHKNDSKKELLKKIRYKIRYNCMYIKYWRSWFNLGVTNNSCDSTFYENTNFIFILINKWHSFEILSINKKNKAEHCIEGCWKCLKEKSDCIDLLLKQRIYYEAIFS